MSSFQVKFGSNIFQIPSTRFVCFNPQLWATCFTEVLLLKEAFLLIILHNNAIYSSLQSYAFRTICSSSRQNVYFFECDHTYVTGLFVISAKGKYMDGRSFVFKFHLIVDVIPRMQAHKSDQNLLYSHLLPEKLNAEIYKNYNLT